MSEHKRRCEMITVNYRRVRCCKNCMNTRSTKKTEKGWVSTELYCPNRNNEFVNDDFVCDEYRNQVLFEVKNDQRK